MKPKTISVYRLLYGALWYMGNVHFYDSYRVYANATTFTTSPTTTHASEAALVL